VNLDQTFAQLQLFESERQKLYQYTRKSQQDDLDARELAQALAHRAEIDDAIAKHEDVRRQAMAVLEAHVREEQEKARRRQEEEDRKRRAEEEAARRKAEEQRRLKEEHDRKVKEEADKKLEAERRASEQRAKAEQAEKMRLEREATAEKERKDRAKAEADAEAAKKRQDAAKAASQKTSSGPVLEAVVVSGNEPAWSSHPEIRHKHYLNIHKSLKSFRKDFWEQIKKTPQLKAAVGDMRRVMRVAVGQITSDDKMTNSKAVSQLLCIHDDLLIFVDQKSEGKSFEGAKRRSFARSWPQQLFASTLGPTRQRHHESSCVRDLFAVGV
jgi:nucleoporin GLE1